MIAKKVEILTKSYKDEPAALWRCDGTPDFSLKKGKKEIRGMEMILLVAVASEEFLEDQRNRELLAEYS